MVIIAAMAKKTRQSTPMRAPPPPIPSPDEAVAPPLTPDPSTVALRAQSRHAHPGAELKPIPAPPRGPTLPAGSQWAKGMSANPGGVPRGARVSTRMAEMMSWTRAEVEALKADDTAEVRDHLAARAILRAMKNDDANADMNTLLDRTEGKVAQDFNVRATPTMTPEQVAEQVRNSGILDGGNKDEF